MQKQKNKKIWIYFFLFLAIGSLNNKNFKEFNFKNIDKIRITGLEGNNKFELLENLDFLKINNLFFLNKENIIEIIRSNDLVENYSVFKTYPSTLKIKIDKTKFLAKVKKKGKSYFLGSNGRLIAAEDIGQEIPFIFGNFENKNFFELKKAIDQSNFDYSEIKNLFFFKSGRWDIETNSGLLIKLPKNNIKKSLDLFFMFLIENNDKTIKQIDLRQLNQIIVNE